MGLYLHLSRACASSKWFCRNRSRAAMQSSRARDRSDREHLETPSENTRCRAEWNLLNVANDQATVAGVKQHHIVCDSGLFTVCLHKRSPEATGSFSFFVCLSWRVILFQQQAHRPTSDVYSHSQVSTLLRRAKQPQEARRAKWLDAACITDGRLALLINLQEHMPPSLLCWQRYCLFQSLLHGACDPHVSSV